MKSLQLVFESVCAQHPSVGPNKPNLKIFEQGIAHLHNTRSLEKKGTQTRLLLHSTMEMLCSIIYIFAALLFATQATGEGGYGLDCSFPIHSRDGILRTDCGDLPSRQAFYDNYMQGCKQVYDEEDCKDTELLRLEMNLRQPQSMVVR